MRRKLSSHSAWVWLYIMGGNMEKGIKQGKSSYLLLSMKKDQANKTKVERVYRQQPLAWEPGPNGSGIDPQLVWEWVQHSCTSCASMHWSWSGAEAEEVEWVQMGLEAARGGWRGGREVIPWQVGWWGGEMKHMWYPIWKAIWDCVWLCWCICRHRTQIYCCGTHCKK